ncbi:MAG TPA: hypothetical protein DIW47_02335 [Bacteroidetes bacterium]|nr:hypothetical protein [Bacteroidota bacterium]
MPKDGNITRARILEETHNLVNNQGFSGTSIDHILERSGITKGAFFYHFKSKQALAKALMEDFARKDMDELQKLLLEYKKKKDPLEGFLHMLDLFIKMMKKMDQPHEGCLYAAYGYEPGQFDSSIKTIIQKAMNEWTIEIEKILDAILARYEPALPIDKHALAEQMGVIAEGSFIYEKTMNKAGITAAQVQHLRNYIVLLFAGPGKDRV